MKEAKCKTENKLIWSEIKNSIPLPHRQTAAHHPETTME